MRRWRPSFSPWLILPLLLLVGLGALAVLAVLELSQALQGSPSQWRIDRRSFGLLLGLLATLAVFVFFLYRLASVLTLSYLLERNGVIISWLGNRAVIPMDRIQSIDVGAPGARLPRLGLSFFGYRRGTGQLDDGRPLQLFASAPLKRCLVIYLGDSAYALSPRARDEFVQELEQRRSLGVVQALTEGVERSRYLNYAFWSDTFASGALFLVLVLNLLLWYGIASRYDSLGAQVLLRLDPTGAVVQPRHHVLLLPLVAMGLTLFNLFLGLQLYLRERGAALLLQVASLLVHLLALAALLSIIGWQDLPR